MRDAVREEPWAAALVGVARRRPSPHSTLDRGPRHGRNLIAAVWPCSNLGGSHGPVASYREGIGVVTAASLRMTDSLRRLAARPW